MRTDFPTKLSLSEWARIIGIHPLHFAQIQFAPQGKAIFCAQPYFQYPWQDVDRVSRDEIAQAILEAETAIERALGARLMPSWENDEYHVVEKPRPELINFSGTTQRGYNMGVQSDWGHIISGGIRAVTLLGNPGVSWSSSGASGAQDDVGTVTIAGLVAADLPNDVCEVRLFFENHAGDPEWEIKPLSSVTLAGGVLTITFRRELAVLPAMEEAFDPVGLVWTTDANFAADLDVYRVYNDDTTQATILWEPVGGCGCVVGGSSCVQCQWSSQVACLLPRDFRTGIFGFTPASYDATNARFVTTSFSGLKAPDAIRMYYYAGIQDKGRQCGARDLDRSWQRAIAVYAASMLDRAPCDCSNDQWQVWREDLSLDEGSEDFGMYRTPTNVLENPFGSRRGAVTAWRRILASQDLIGGGVWAG